MGQIEELFYENPGKEFYLRQLSRLTRTPKTTAARTLNQLIKNKLITRNKNEPYDTYSANTENPLYKFYKTQDILERIHKSGVIEYIYKHTNPKAIILFGSCAKGDYTKDSDIDIFVQSNKTNLDLSFKLKHKINLFFETNLNKLSNELLNNILNGITLHGLIRLERDNELQSLQKTSSKTRTRRSR
ncbi:nucleotidyltransferase family protein [Nanoarchaeota archaeon]